MLLFELWLWGLVASTIIDVPISWRVKRNIKKNNPSFLDYFKNRSKLSKIMHNIKSFGKILIPGINIIYPFWLFAKRFHLGYDELADSYEQKIRNIDYKKKLIKDNFDGLIKNINKTFKKNPVKKSQLKTNTSVTKPIASPVIKKDTQKNCSTQEVKNEQNVFSDNSKSKYESLHQYFDKLNNSSISTEALLDFYSKEYWSIRKEYDNLVKFGQDTTEAYEKLLLIFNKRKELKELRNVQEQGSLLPRK